MTNTTQVGIPEKCKGVVTTAVRFRTLMIRLVLDLWSYDTRQEGSVVLRERPTPVPGENEILVKVAAIGINPTDWKSKHP